MKIEGGGVLDKGNEGKKSMSHKNNLLFLNDDLNDKREGSHNMNHL